MTVAGPRTTAIGRGRMLRVNLTTGDCRTAQTPAGARRFIGGRGLNVKTVFDEVPPGVGPFDPANPLCIAPGFLAGTPSPSSSRTSITAVSPRGLVDTSGLGGFFGAELKFAGYDQIIVTGRAAGPVYLLIEDDRVEIRPADHLWGRDPWSATRAIRDELDDRDVQTAAIGPAGENLVHFAAILTGRLTSAAGRCGMGAIMGSKNLKAVAVRGRGGVRPAQPSRFLAACRDLHTFLRGTAAFENRRGCSADKTMYQRYLRRGKFVAGNWEKFSDYRNGFANLAADPEEFWRTEAQHLQPDGASQPGCFGCPLYHETFFESPGEGDIGRTKCMEWLSMGGTVWLDDRRQVNEAALLCNKRGLDAISTGNCIALLMELHHRSLITADQTDGIAMERGDLAAIKAAIDKIAKAEGFGALFRQGVAGAVKALCPAAADRAMAIKGLELVPEEIRAYKSMALLVSVGKLEQLAFLDYTWVDDPQGSENEAERRYGLRQAAVPHLYDGKAALVFDSELNHTVGDLLGVCKLMVPWGYSDNHQGLTGIVSAALGEEWTEKDLRDAARRTLLLERAVNVGRGLKRADERPPERMFTEPVAEGKYRGSILDNEGFDRMLTEYYELRGCDEQGLPMASALADLGLETVGLPGAGS